MVTMRVLQGGLPDVLSAAADAAAAVLRTDPGAAAEAVAHAVAAAVAEV